MVSTSRNLSTSFNGSFSKQVLIYL
jgi:hypothetical protein